MTALGALWGMNFKYMPELEWKYSYLIALLFIIFTTAGMYMYMRFKGWTGDLLRVKKKKSFLNLINPVYKKYDRYMVCNIY